MIGIRADGNAVIATGHIMRCMAIGDRLREMGEEVIFFLASDEMQELIEHRGYQAEVLGTDWKNMESELDVLLPLLKRYEIQKLLLDSYQVTAHYLKKLTDKVEVTYIDDLRLLDYPVDKIICYSVYSDLDKEKYKQHFKGKQKLYLGLSYIPLRKEFEKGYYRNLKYWQEDGKEQSDKMTVRDILITTGGTDSFHMALGIVEYLEQHSKSNRWHYHVILGKFQPDKEKLQELAKHKSHMHLYENVVDMTILMNQCDVAISAGGTTIFELCACGVPVLSFMMADNQKGIVDLDRIGLVKYVGDVRTYRYQVLERIRNTLENYTKQPKQLLEISKHQRSLIDTKGSQRIANAITG